MWWLVPGLAVLGYYLTRALSQGVISLGELLMLFTLSVVCVLPAVRWLLTDMPHLPLGEGFAFMHVIYYVIPCLGLQQGLADYSSGLRLKALAGLLLYLGTFVAIYWVMTARKQRTLPPKHLLRREISNRMIWTMFIGWTAMTILMQLGKIPFITPATRNVFYALMGALGSISVVCLFYQCGKGRFDYRQMILAVTGLVMGVGALIVAGTLIIGACIVGAAVLAYSLGRKRVSLPAIVVAGLALGFLQAGKTDYRSALHSDADGYVETPSSFSAAYSLWFRVSWDAVTKPKTETKTQSIFERASLIQVLALAVDTVPNKSPYLYGRTYGMIPQLMVPRLLWPDKPRGTYPTELLGVYLGIQTEGGTDTTGIAVGAPTEAWLNFGWPGMALAGAFLALFYGWPARLTRQLEPQSIGWLMCCVFLVSCVDLEHSIPEKICSVGQAMLMSFLILLVISSRPEMKQKPKKTELATTLDVGGESR